MAIALPRRTSRLRGAIAAASSAALVMQLRSASLHWGATDADVQRCLAGDDLLPAADLTATRAVTIRARTSDVWPWVAQLGQGRGGFYSYDALENLVGCDMHSADRIVPAWQDIAVGQEAP